MMKDKSLMQQALAKRAMKGITLNINVGGMGESKEEESQKLGLAPGEPSEKEQDDLVEGAASPGLEIEIESETEGEDGEDSEMGKEELTDALGEPEKGMKPKGLRGKIQQAVAAMKGK